MDMLLERIWNSRFVYRALNDLLPCNRQLEVQFLDILQHRRRILGELLGASNATAPA